MKCLTRSWLRFVSIAVVATAGTAFAENNTVPSSVSEPHRVEFVEVKGQRCLKPVLTTGSAQISDYRAAELRWLAKKYPGVAFSRWETVIILAPQQDTDERDETVKRETAYGHAPDGVSVAVCFDIGLSERDREQLQPGPSV